MCAEHQEINGTILIRNLNTAPGFAGIGIKNIIGGKNEKR